MPDGGEYDVFFSYARADFELARPLRDALTAEGLSVFFDEREIEDFESITRRLTEGVARSKALLALYSKTYPRRRACQFELTAAFLAAQRHGDPRERVLVVNPEEDGEHIEPAELRDALFRRISSSKDSAAIASVAESVARRVQSSNVALGDADRFEPPDWFPRSTRGVSSPRFVGRVPAMWRIHSALHAADLTPMTGVSGPGVAQVRGLGGIGKTFLAREYAVRFGAAYPGGVFWLHAQEDLDGRGGTSEEEREGERGWQVRALAVSLGVAVEGLAPEEVDAALARNVERRRAPFLWVVDDVGHGLEADELRRWFAPHPLGKTLFTTRSAEYGALAAVVEPSVLLPVEALELVTSRRAPEGETERTEAEALAADLGHHALALDVAGAALAFEGARPFAAFRAALAEASADELELAADLADALPTGHEPSVAATFSRSIDRLGEEGRDLLRIASCLASAPIPAWLVDGVFAEADGLDRGEARRRGLLARKQVRSLSLAETTAAGDAEIVHALVARTVRFRDQATPGRRDALRTAAVNVLGIALEAVADGEAYAELELALAHARELASAPATVAEAELIGWVARYDSERGDHRSAETLLRRECDALIELLGDEHRDTLIATNNLATVLREQGKLTEALELHSRVVSDSERLFGEYDPQTLLAVKSLAMTLSEQGDLDWACDLQMRTVEASVRVLGEDDPATLEAINNLAATLHAQGEHAKAHLLQERLVAASQRVLGEEHPQTLTTATNHAEMLREQGKLAEARQIQERVLAARERVLGEEHPDTLLVTGNLAGTLHEQGDLAEARRLQERVLAARERILGEEHPDTLLAMAELAGTLHEQGELGEARQIQERVLAARERVRGEEHPETLAAMNGLARTLHAQGEVAKARRLLLRLASASQRVLGEEHPQTLTAMNNIAWTLHKQGETAEAREIQERVLEARSRVLGHDHISTLQAMGNLALMLAAQGELSKARQFQERVLAARGRVLGDEHPATLRAMANLAKTLRKQGDLSAADGLEQRALELGRTQPPGDAF